MLWARRVVLLQLRRNFAFPDRHTHAITAAVPPVPNHTGIIVVQMSYDDRGN